MTAKERPAGGASGPKGQKFKSPASSLRQIAARAQVLVIEHATTADLPDGRQMPPLGDGWHAVGRITGTRWRRIALPNPTNDELCRRRRRRLEQCERAEKWRNTMDVSKYLGNAAFLKVGDVKVNGPIRVVIESVTEGKFDKPDLTFDDGTRLSINVTNTRTLARAYGTDGADWIGKEIELYLGEIPYQGKLQESILVKPISPPIEKRPPKPKGESDKRGDLDDEIPFSAGDESKSGRSNRLSRPRLVNS